jgi:hypothetical protein
MLRTFTWLGGLVVGAALTTSVITGAPAGRIRTGQANAATKFCTSAKALTATLPSSLAELKIATAKRTAKRLADLSDVAPSTTAKAMRSMSKQLAAYAAADGSAARVTVAARKNGDYAAQRAVVAGYVSRYCPAPLPTSPSFGPITAASETACLQDQTTIKQAEDLYSTLNGTFGSMTDLVAAQFLHQVSSYYADVQVDDPPGGYTLIAVANGPCANVPVAG